MWYKYNIWMALWKSVKATVTFNSLKYESLGFSQNFSSLLFFIVSSCVFWRRRFYTILFDLFKFTYFQIGKALCRYYWRRSLRICEYSILSKSIFRDTFSFWAKFSPTFREFMFSFDFIQEQLLYLNAGITVKRIFFILFYTNWLLYV